MRFRRRHVQYNTAAGHRNTRHIRATRTCRVYACGLQHIPQTEHETETTRAHRPYAHNSQYTAATQHTAEATHTHIHGHQIPSALPPRSTPQLGYAHTSHAHILGKLQPRSAARCRDTVNVRTSMHTQVQCTEAAHAEATHRQHIHAHYTPSAMQPPSRLKRYARTSTLTQVLCGYAAHRRVDAHTNLRLIPGALQPSTGQWAATGC